MRRIHFVQTKQRVRNSVMAALFLGTQLIAVTSPFMRPAAVGATQNQHSDKVRICHRTSSYNNPYSSIEVSKSAVDGVAGNSGNEADHYGEHKGPVFYPSIPKDTSWGDIIPPVQGSHNGLNWTTAGQNVWNNACNFDKGDLGVDKRVDQNGDGGYELGSADSTSEKTAIKNLGFYWGYNAEPVTNQMGNSVEDLPVGSYAITETNVAGYQFKGWYYTDQEDNHGSGQVNCTHPQGTTLPQVTVSKHQTKRITLCNQFKPGSIKIVKDAQPDDNQDFSFTSTGSGVSNFTLDDNGSESTNNGGRKSNVLFEGLTAGSYSFTEGGVNGWDLSNVSCTGQDKSTFSRQGNTLNVSLVAGEDLVCTFTNQKRGKLIVQKTTVPAGSQTQFGITASGTGTITNGASGSISDATDHTYHVTPGTYTVTETVPAGWSKTGDTCKDVVVAAGATVTCLITNTKLGSISGNKYSVNGDNNLGNTLPGWTIFIDANSNGSLDQGEKSTVTDQNGAYSFSDLLPGNYVLKEVLIAGWTQIFGPGTVNLNAGQNAAEKDFGNQGRGSIKVVKNVDTDGDGDVDVYGDTNWTWDIDDEGNFATGSTQNVAAGEYTISEDQQEDYHFVSVSCVIGDYELEVNQHVSFDLSVEAGDNIVCTFTNARDTATITVNKVLAPSEDNGKFNLLIDSTVYASNVGNDGTTGQITVPTGTYSVSETASEGTDLSDYVTTNTCDWGQRGGGGEGALVTDLTVQAGEELVCTFFNTRYAEIVVTKYNDINRNGWFDEGEDTLPNWEFNVIGEEYCDWGEYDLAKLITSDLVLPSCGEGGGYDESQATGENGSTTFVNIVPGADHQITETSQEGWKLSSIYCGDVEGSYDSENETMHIGGELVLPGDTIHCYAGNFRDEVDLNITKENNTTGDVQRGATVTYTLTVSVPENHAAVFDATVTDILPEGLTYVPGSWTSTVAETTDPLFNPVGNWYLGDLYPGDSVTLTYQATVDYDTAAGTYTNVARAEGCAVPERPVLYLAREAIAVDEAGYECPEPVYSELAESDVTVDVPQVLGTTTPTVLPATGAEFVMQNILISLLVVSITLVIAYGVRRQYVLAK